MYESGVRNSPIKRHPLIQPDPCAFMKHCTSSGPFLPVVDRSLSSPYHILPLSRGGWSLCRFQVCISSGPSRIALNPEMGNSQLWICIYSYLVLGNCATRKEARSTYLVHTTRVPNGTAAKRYRNTAWPPSSANLTAHPQHSHHKT